MRFGVVYPQTEYPTDPVAIREYAQAAEELGYRHILAYDHVLGANPERPGGWRGPYTHEHSFMEPFSLFSYLAGVTNNIEFATGVIVLPQRNTALVAKQSAMLDLLSGGRLRLGVGIGWNAVEYEGMGENFKTRGRRIEEQVELLKRLWTEELVSHQGRWHQFSDVGINPLPEHSIPLWYGGHHENVLRRIAKQGDGWMPNYRKAIDAQVQFDRLDQFLELEGRSRKDLGLEVRIQYGDGNADTWKRTLEEWKPLGITHVSLNTMSYGFDSAQKHLEAIKRFADELGLSSD
jgi:probable F420-dependent oxidoreductase